MRSTKRGVVSVAILKSEAMTLAAERRDEFKCTERKIDEEICSRYVGNSVFVYLDNFPSEKVRQALEEVYKTAGWDISFYFETRGRSFVILS